MEVNDILSVVIKEPKTIHYRNYDPFIGDNPDCGASSLIYELLLFYQTPHTTSITARKVLPMARARISHAVIRSVKYQETKSVSRSQPSSNKGYIWVFQKQTDRWTIYVTFRKATYLHTTSDSWGLHISSLCQPMEHYTSSFLNNIIVILLLSNSKTNSWIVQYTLQYFNFFPIYFLCTSVGVWRLPR